MGAHFFLVFLTLKIWMIGEKVVPLPPLEINKVLTLKTKKL